MELKRTKQCAHCPWRKDACVDDILGYSPELHPKLAETIANSSNWSALYRRQLKIMACHESSVGDETACIGWLANQLGPGNNIALRFAMLSCPERGEIETFGEQHKTFEDTLPAY